MEDLTICLLVIALMYVPSWVYEMRERRKKK